MGRCDELVARREFAGFTQEGLAHYLQIAVATVSSWERGLRRPGPRFRRPLAEALDVNLVELDRLLGIDVPIELNGHRVQRWLNTYESLALECARLDIVARSAIPAMLQTRDYATGVERSVPDATDEQVAERVRVRLARQAVLEAGEPLAIVAILHESVLRDVVGGPDVMVGQLDHLLSVAKWSNVEILVLPADGRAMFIPGEFELLVMHGEIEAFMGVTVDPGGANYHERDVHEFAAMFKHARNNALPPDQSARRIEETRETCR